MKKTNADKVVDIWVRYANHLIKNGLDMKAIDMRTKAISETHKLVK